uniref:Reverse transcriptase domain-containing protein n=1 Tax=Lactuca sativa TaxID=4236 RepID=A0A9R1WFL1_LACSA|nr:hypothetical protein LSAT_V11C200055230 [Lactuca sativa]
MQKKLTHLIPNSYLITSVSRTLDFEPQPYNHLSPDPDKSIDLNVTLPVASNNGDSADICSSSNEISSILKIGNEVGFQIGEDNIGILEDVLEMEANGEETHVANLSRDDVTGCWGNIYVEFEIVLPQGKSGGLLCMWDPKSFLKSNVVSSRYFLAISGKWMGIPGNTTLVNVYAPQSITDKRKLWEELLHIKNFDGIWVFFGDFNAVRRSDERFNSAFCKYTAADFNQFIANAGLKELKMGGLKYTYYKEEGHKFSKIDRFLVCSNFICSQPSSSVTALPRLHSDHSPIVLKPSIADFGPPPFRFFNLWILNDEFRKEFTKSWTCFHGYGTPDIILKAKLKHVKNQIRKWKKDDSKNGHGSLTNLRSRVNDMERTTETRCISESEKITWREDKAKLLELEHIVKLDLQQRAKIKWLTDGDENSRFFHGSLANANRKNKIHGLLINGSWEVNPELIKLEALQFFASKFKENWPVRPLLISPLFKQLSIDQQQSLELAITPEEIKNAVWSCGGDKSLGPDGITFKIIKENWDLMSEDIINFVKYFEQNAHLAKGCNPSFITLIPKVSDPISLADYRPISLIGCMYKMIAKVLAIRLKSVIGSVISDIQSAFVPGRNILDAPLIINEIFSWAKQLNYDANGFGSKWRTWIRGCLASSMASVLVNGSPTTEFPISRGVRQGDPLSPFLFIIAMEGLNISINNACSKKLIKGIKLPNGGPRLSHLFYADDAIFAGEWCSDSIKNLSRILRCFHISSGLKVNFLKSRLFGIRVSSQEVQRMARFLGCTVGTFPFTYLGVPIGANMALKKNWQPIVDKFKSKLSTWKAKSLSFGGHLTLIKSVLNSLPTYYMSLFKAPQGILDLLEKLRRRFLWGGGQEKNKLHWVDWSKKKKVGGLGVGSLKAQNISLLTKWWWRVRNERDQLWSEAIISLHDLKKKPATCIARKTLAGAWCNIKKAICHLDELSIDRKTLFKLTPRRGSNILFWKDTWCGNSPFQDRFPNLYKREKEKSCRLDERLSASGFN